MKISDIRALREGETGKTCRFFALLKSLQSRKAKNGSDFLMLEFGDNTGTLAGMCFDSSPAFNQLKNASAGDVFETEAEIDFYQGRLSPKIFHARKLDSEEAAACAESLVERSPLNPEEMRSELQAAIDRISDSVLKSVVETALEEAGAEFFTSVAAVRMHHAYLNGLLEHTLKCARTTIALLPLYPFVDADLALAGTILHDIGKVLEYSQGLAVEKTRVGILQGHVVLGYRMVRRAAIKCGLDPLLRERLEHIILSHQGELEWGAAAKAATPEAVFVSSIDNLDAKLGAVESAIRNAEGAEFVDVPALRLKVLATPPIHPQHTDI